MIEIQLNNFFFFFGIVYIIQAVLNKTRDKPVTHNIFRIQENESSMCGFYCIAFIEYMVARETLLYDATLHSMNEYKNGDKRIQKYFKDKYGRGSKS